MAKSLKLNITKKHIQKGEPDQSDSCAIALAIGEALQTHYKRCADPLGLINLDSIEISVDTDVIKVGERTMTPSKKVVEFIEAFDEQDEPPDAGAYADGEQSPQYKNDLKEWQRQQKRIKPFSFNLKLS